MKTLHRKLGNQLFELRLHRRGFSVQPFHERARCYVRCAWRLVCLVLVVCLAHVAKPLQQVDRREAFGATSVILPVQRIRLELLCVVIIGVPRIAVFGNDLPRCPSSDDFGRMSPHVTCSKLRVFLRAAINASTLLRALLYFVSFAQGAAAHVHSTRSST